MAIDTAAKRQAAAFNLIPINSITLPDGTVDQGDRQWAAWIYGGILAGAVAAPAPVVTSTRIWEAIAVKLAATSAVTNLVGANIYHGMRPPKDTGNYSINYFRSASTNIILDTRGVVENPVYQISCRAKTASNAQELAYVVKTTLQNLEAVIGNGFDINLANIFSVGGLIEEEDGEWYHVPLSVRFIYFSAENA